MTGLCLCSRLDTATAAAAAGASLLLALLSCCCCHGTGNCGLGSPKLLPLSVFINKSYFYIYFMNTLRAPSCSIIYVVERQQEQLLQDDKSCRQGQGLALSHSHSHTHTHWRMLNWFVWILTRLIHKSKSKSSFWLIKCSDWALFYCCCSHSSSCCCWKCANSMWCKLLLLLPIIYDLLLLY